MTWRAGGGGAKVDAARRRTAGARNRPPARMRARLREAGRARAAYTGAWPAPVALARTRTPHPRPRTQIHTAFGNIKTYGEDFGSRTEGRRYFVPEYKHTDSWDGNEYHR